MLGLAYTSDSDDDDTTTSTTTNTSTNTTKPTSTSTHKTSTSTSIPTTTSTSTSLFSSLSSLPAPKKDKKSKKKSKRKHEPDDDLFIPTNTPDTTSSTPSLSLSTSTRNTSLTSLLPAPKFANTSTNKKSRHQLTDTDTDTDTTTTTTTTTQAPIVEEETIIDAGEDTYPDTSAAYAPPASRPFMSAAAAAYAITDDTTSTSTSYDTSTNVQPEAVQGMMDRKFIGRNTIDPSRFISIKQSDLTHRTIQEELHAQLEQQFAPKDEIQVNAKFWNAQNGTQTVVTDSSHMDSVHKRKHQINTLAVQAANMELQLAKQRAQGHQQRQMARAKYGW